ncbi:MAG: hypothetical protein Q9162_000591 [Coniocarpon cinnabarinum]
MDEFARPHKRARFSRDVEPDRNINIDQARQQSRGQFRSRLEGVLQKYGKDFTGLSDVVNFETNEVEEDNGHLAGMRHEYDTGARMRSRRAVIRQGLAEPDAEPAERTENNSGDELSNVNLIQKRRSIASHSRQPPATPPQPPQPPQPLQLNHSSTTPHENDGHTQAETVTNQQQVSTPAPNNANTAGLSPEVIAQIGQTIAQQLAKLLTPGSSATPRLPVTNAVPKQESIWDGPPLPHPPRSRLEQHATEEQNVQTPWNAQDSERLSSSPQLYSRNSLWAPRDHERGLPPDGRSFSRRKTILASLEEAAGADWTAEEDAKLLDIIRNSLWVRSGLEEELKPLFPQRELNAIRTREWFLRSTAGSDSASFFAMPPTADVSLIYLPTSNKFRRSWKTRLSNNGEVRSWSVDDVKKMAKLRMEQPSMSTHELATHFPDRGVDAVKACYQRWKSGMVDKLLRQHSILDPPVTSQSSPPVPVSQTPTFVGVKVPVSSPAEKPSHGPDLDFVPNGRLKRVGKRKWNEPDVSSNEGETSRRRSLRSALPGIVDCAPGVNHEISPARPSLSAPEHQNENPVDGTNEKIKLPKDLPSKQKPSHDTPLARKSKRMKIAKPDPSSSSTKKKISRQIQKEPDSSVALLNTFQPRKHAGHPPKVEDDGSEDELAM